MDHEELAATWTTVRNQLQTDFQVSQAIAGFLRLTRPMALIDGDFLLMAPNDLTKRMIEDRLSVSVLDLLQRELNQPGLRLRVVVDGAGLKELNLSEQVVAPAPVESRSARSGTPADAPPDQAPAVPADRSSFEPPQQSRQPNVQQQPPSNRLTDRTTDRTTDRPAAPPNAASAAAERFGGAEVARETSGQTSGPDWNPGGRRPRDQRTPEPARLNPKYTFDSFVIGSSNRFAHAAAVAVAEAPAQAYNPLFVYGDSGLGKTHLLHAIGDYAQNLYPSVQVRFVNSEEFTNEFINSIRDDRASVFQARYRDVDILLIDDIQFLQGKVQTQEEFFHTFNALHQTNKQVVITSDVAPRFLSGFEERMRSRFEWGLLTDIQPPDLETRIAILRKKAAADRLDGPDDVLEYIGSNISTNIRELEGALIRVTAYANLNKLPVTLTLAQSVLKDLIGEQEHEVTASRIIAVTAEYFEISEDDIVGPSRSRLLVTARQTAMYLCREMTELSLPKIGSAFGNRDHTTVIHAYRKIRDQMAEKPSVYNQVNDLGIRLRKSGSRAAAAD